jgi:hypothetical protein
MKENTKRFWQFRTKRKCYYWITVISSFVAINLPFAWILWHIGDDNHNAIQTDHSVITGSKTLSHPPPDVCDNPGRYIPDQISSHWRYIDETVQNGYPNARVSGGIFLYPRQTSILSYLIRQIQAGLNRKMTICETGFGSGHSLALFAEIVAGYNKHNNSKSVTPGTDQQVHIVSFDKFDRPYQMPLWHHWNDTIGGGQPQRLVLEFVAGDSCRTVPAFLSDSVPNMPREKERKHPAAKNFHCDVLHGSSLCPTDNIDLVERSPCGVLLTSTAMNELTDKQVYFGKHAQWRNLRQQQCITDIVCFHEDRQDISRDFVFAKRGSTHVGKFCIAMTTGKCQKPSGGPKRDNNVCNTDIHAVVKSLQLQEICRQDQIPAPV